MKLIGTIFGFYETGTEGVCWSLSIDGKQGYDALASVNADDLLTIFNEDGSIAFQGKIDPDYQIGYQPYPLNPKSGQPCALGFCIHWTQKGWQPDAWAALFLREEFGKKPLRAELEKKRFFGTLALLCEPEKPMAYILVLHDFDQKQHGISHLPIEQSDRLIISDDEKTFANGGRPVFNGIVGKRPWARKKWSKIYWLSMFALHRRGTLIKP